VEAATIRYLMYVLLPAWFVPGVADWIMHRRTKIEGREARPAARYLTGVFAAVAAFVVAPYAEEAIRCLRARGYRPPVRQAGADVPGQGLAGRTP
jgi:hypothetical protein